MADSSHFKKRDVQLIAKDEFHRASTVIPVHHPYTDGECALDQTGPCTFKGYTVSEITYNGNTEFTKLERFQVAAKDIRTKFKSR